MNSPTAMASYRWLFWLLAIVGLTADQVSKYGIFSHLYNGGSGGSIIVLPDAFNIVAQFDRSKPLVGDGPLHWLRSIGGIEHWPHLNYGALFGIGQNQSLLFAAVSVVAAVFIVGWSVRESAGRDWFLCVALGLILSGTLGNLYDRVVFGGVRDFFHWFKWYDWPVFNIADICLVTGAGLLLLEAFFRKPAEQAAVSDANS